MPASAEDIMLSFATKTPDTKPMVRTRKSDIIRYLRQSPESSLATRLRSGFLTLRLSILATPHGYLAAVEFAGPYHAVPQLNNVIRYFPDSLVVRYHNDGTSVFFVYIFNQLENFF